MTSTPSQLDIFADSRDVMLRNDVVATLERGDASGARLAWQALREACPDDPSLAELATLLEHIETRDALPFADLMAARQAGQQLTAEVEPAARRVLGASARAWLVPAWRGLALRAAALRFEAEHADAHAAASWLRAGDWAAARDAVAGIESWRRIPIPLAWMTQAVHGIDGLDAAWPLLAELAWLAPGRFDAVARTLAGTPLHKLRRRFDAEFDGQGTLDDLAWFPAWALIDEPRLAGVLRAAQPGLHSRPEQALRLVLELLGLERRGAQAEVLARRKRLSDCHAGLFAAYMKTR